MNANTRLLIDADSLVYKAGCSNETREYIVQDPSGHVVHSCQYMKEAKEYIQQDPDLTPVLTVKAGKLSHSLAGAKFLVESILDAVPHKTYQLYIGGEGNFRKDLYPEYKANRASMLRPVHEQEIREYLVRKYNAELVHGEEADDRVSYKQCADIDNTCIVGIDKDLWNTPGWHWNYVKKKLDNLTFEQADWNFWTQMLQGDPSDNIPCVPGIGPKKALRALQGTKYEHLHDTVYNIYKEHGYSYDYFILMGRLLWMRRKPNEMWLP